jgi:ferredoxin--NADP+ reductase
MGQRIEVDANPLGEIALFSLDRSLTGQDGVAFTRPGESGEEPTVALARRLFAADDRIDHVHILSNTVSARRRDGWDDEEIERASEVIAELFVHYQPENLTPDDIERLRAENYNASLSYVRAHNDELWVLRVKPDRPIDPFEPGQYTTLALGFWEPRADEALEDITVIQEKKMARRSYSVSSSMVDDSGELLPAQTEDVEFYIVKVRPDQDEIPALTPRIFLKQVGDRIYMGRKFTGRYTLEGVAPTDNVVFLSTGTGEAPHNTMTAELLRRGHQGRILGVVCVRYRADLAYLDQHAALTARFPNYSYVTLTTREPETVGQKVYIQDMIESGQLEEKLGTSLDPATTHVYLCGNPLMIGLPAWTESGPVFPETLGVCQQLHERGFAIDRGRERGQVHYEEFWTSR